MNKPVLNVSELLRNALTRNLSAMFPGYFQNAKHNHYADFGWPTTLTFDQLYSAWRRNSIAKAAVSKTSRKVWQDYPFLQEQEKQHKETKFEAELRQRFADLRVWQRVAEAERRSLVGNYGALILRVADSKEFREPVDRVAGGLDALVEVIPAWENQLTVSEWDDDQRSETYGQPKMFEFREVAVGTGAKSRGRTFSVHPDRVVIFSKDGTVFGESLLEAGYNDLMTLEKVSGAGGEGFWKNAKSSPVLEVDKEAKLTEMAQAMGVELAELTDAMNEQTEAWQKGFDKLLMLQGITAKTLPVTLPSPEHFYGVALNSFAASVEIPVKILVGMQTGERASQEDAREWAQTCMGRRSDVTVPTIMEFVNRLERFGLLPERDWFLSWTDLTEASMAEKIERADKMSKINQSNAVFGEETFTRDEIRESVDHEPMGDFEDDGQGDNLDDETDLVNDEE